MFKHHHPSRHLPPASKPQKQVPAPPVVPVVLKKPTPAPVVVPKTIKKK